MKIIDSITEMQSLSFSFRSAGKRIGLVPTMGFLHNGHASLMVEGRTRSDFLVTTIFVNPTQFGAGEDFEKYPRSLDHDITIATKAGVDVIFTPSASEMYPPGYQTYVNVEKVTLPLCGSSRPGHFKGVTTVVAKLFGIVQPDLALFGRKDYQQLAVIKQMTKDLNFPVEIIGMPIIREEDGLAMSSRNSYLSANERQDALCLKAAIDRVKTCFKNGETQSSQLKSAAMLTIATSSSASVDYIQFCDSDSLEPVEVVDRSTLMALAVKIGKTRLIDNVIIGEE